MKEKVTTKMVTICSTKPERQCTKPDGPSFRDDKSKQKCRNVYETGNLLFFFTFFLLRLFLKLPLSVCETQHIQKNVTESKPTCTTSDMVMEVNGNIVKVPVKVTSKLISRFK